MSIQNIIQLHDLGVGVHDQPYPWAKANFYVMNGQTHTKIMRVNYIYFFKKYTRGQFNNTSILF